ncbi:MAG TPA: methionine--tRNA ligase [Actinomycetota bacterium]|nr:methionine--tRNA ligase [Actinomycetota bacterium]
MSSAARPVLVCVAWPYANGDMHLGHVGGAYLPADVFARYKRQRGERVLMVSGSDAHGTPILVKAEETGVEPIDVVTRYHEGFVALWDELGISFDLFTTTMTENHTRVVQDFLMRLHERGYIYKDVTEQFYDEEREQFLPDRYVEGTCPHCGYAKARGDQCENCGKTLDPEELVEPRSRLSGARPVLRPTEHLFFRLSALQDELLAWLSRTSGWRAHVLNWSLAFVEGGLKDRAITRDLSWGIPVPEELGLPPGKRIYVWFEAVLGYLSATVEWSQRDGAADWREWWTKPEAQPYYFIGKDNIPFHTVIWPAMLLAHGDLELPKDVPANQYVLLEGLKASKSGGLGQAARDYLKVMPPDALRYALSSVLPETADTELSDGEIVQRVNSELASAWGNLVNRALTLAERYCGGRVPEAAHDEAGDAILAAVDRAVADAGDALDAVQLRRGLRIVMDAVQEVNAYVSQQEPWKVAKEDPARAAQVVGVTLRAVAGLATALIPYLPHSSAAVLEALSLDPAAAAWARPPLDADMPVARLDPLFPRLELPLQEPAG